MDKTSFFTLDVQDIGTSVNRDIGKRNIVEFALLIAQF